MPRTQVRKLAFNRGLASKLAFARSDVRRLAFAAEVQTNWMTRVLGSMMLRPGTGYLGNSRNHLPARHLPFVFSIAQKAILELTNQKLRVWVDDALVTRPAVATTVRNPNFTSETITWTERTNPKNFALNDIIRANNKYIAVGAADGTDAYLVTSDDSITWTERTNPKNFALNDIAFGNQRFVAVGNADGVDAYLIYSTDQGQTWNERTNPKNFALNSIAFNDGGTFVAVGAADGTDAYIVTSGDGFLGLTFPWYEAPNAKNFALRAVTWASGLSLWVAVGAADGTDAYMLTSPDGFVWTERSNPKNFGLNKVLWVNDLGLLVAVGDADGADAYIVTSPDGITWTERGNSKNFALNSVAYANGLLTAVGNADGTDAYMLTSPDGINWAEQSNPKNFNLLGIHSGVAVGAADGTDAYLITGLTDWVVADEAGAVSSIASGLLSLLGSGSAYAIRQQQVSVAAADQGVEHGLRIVITRGPVILRVGSAVGSDDYITETELGTGTHSLAFTPTGSSFWVEFKSALDRIVLVDSCNTDTSGTLEIPAPWLQADLSKIRAGERTQSGDIMFVPCAGYQQYKIERRATTSWSVVKYEPEDGPFRTLNTTTITLTPTGLSGNIQLIASKPLFRSGHVGALFRLDSVGQRVEQTITAENVFSEAIRVTGVDAGRAFNIEVTGLSGTGSTVVLQRAPTDAGDWSDVTGESYTTNQTKLFDDGFDNAVLYYRIGVKTGGYVAGTIRVILDFAAGSTPGVVRVTAFTSDTEVSAEVLNTLGNTEPTEDWYEGQWSTYRGFPTSGVFDGGRLVWAGKDKFDFSVSDAFDSFDPEFEGDAGPISRSIGSGPVDTIEWMLSLQRLLAGGQMAELSIRASTLDEPITATNFALKRGSTQGSASVDAVEIDKKGIHVQRGGTRVYELAMGNDGEYESTHLSALIPEIGQPGIVRIGVQRQPDTRIHFVRSDGTVAVLVFDRVENVICWLEIETDGLIEDVVTLPGDAGDEEDFVYYSVARTISGATKRYLEKWAFESECTGAATNKLADSFVLYSGAATTEITGLSHLEGKQVVVWANGEDVGTNSDGTLIYTVSGGKISLATAATPVVVGLRYTAPWKSAKFVELVEQLGGSLLDQQLILGLGLIMANVHAKGLKYGQSLVESEMRDLPEIEAGTTVDPDAVRADYAEDPVIFPGTWSNDARLCLLAKAPRPATVLAALAEVEHHG